ncbi:hypothetical protein [Mollivirus kamchatka]|nr:hypothetical protein [Mollivirus kamchatka]
MKCTLRASGGVEYIIPRPKRSRTQKEEREDDDDIEELYADLDDEPQDMLAQLGRMMPGWTIGLMSMLRPRDVCSLMATSRRLSTYFMRTNGLYCLGMAASLSGRLHLEFDVQGKSIQRIVDVSLPESDLWCMVPNKSFEPGRRLAEALQDFSSQGDAWLALAQRSAATSHQAVGISVHKPLAKHSARLQRCWLRVFSALNDFPCAQGARTFISASERLVHDSLAINTNKLLVRTNDWWHTNRLYSIYTRVGVRPAPCICLLHHMWFPLSSFSEHLPPVERGWHPIGLWLARHAACHLMPPLPFGPPIRADQPQDLSGLETLAFYLETNLEFSGASESVGDVLLDWASEDNIGACNDKDILMGLAHAAFCVLWNNTIRDMQAARRSMQTLCSIITRTCRGLGQSLGQILASSAERAALADPAHIWAGARLCTDAIKRFYEDQLDLMSVDDASARQERDLPLVKFLHAMWMRVISIKEKRKTTLDAVDIKRMRHSLELTFQCLDAK